MPKIRYLVTDVDRSAAFYTQHLGFRLEQQAGPDPIELFEPASSFALRV